MTSSNPPNRFAQLVATAMLMLALALIATLSQSGGHETTIVTYPPDPAPIGVATINSITIESPTLTNERLVVIGTEELDRIKMPPPPSTVDPQQVYRNVYFSEHAASSSMLLKITKNARLAAYSPTPPASVVFSVSPDIGFVSPTSALLDRS